MRAGMDVARLNFSHGTHDDHALVIKRIREASARLSKPIGILADLQGPKIRTGLLKGRQPVQLVAGQRFTISIKPVAGTAEGVSTTYKRMARDVSRGDRILLGDGLIELHVLSTTSTEVQCKVINGGLLGENKGINLPGVKLKIPAVTAKDHKDLVFALEQGANFIAVSFVRDAKDVMQAKKAILQAKHDIPVIAKLEKPEAIEHLDEILNVADAVMVARGDLGVEMSPEKVPVVQKQIIARACEARRPVITATQMLESMTQNPRPTRAEASDVANAVFDGSDALMLSAETASGAYPLEAVEMMDRIIREAEANNSHVLRPCPAQFNIAETASELICHASEELHMKVIAVFTETGNTARMISKYRPRVSIYAFSHNGPVCNRMNLFWGVHPVRRREQARSAEDMVNTAERELLHHGKLKPGDVLGVVAGTQMASGSTNFMRLHTVPEPVTGGGERRRRARKSGKK